MFPLTLALALVSLLSTPEPAQHPAPLASVVTCRLKFDADRTEPDGYGWSTDYPRAEWFLLTRVAEMTTVRVETDGPSIPPMPRWRVVTGDARDLFKCPMLLATDVGVVRFAPEEVVGLQRWFDKGGFLWADDFWGDRAWEQWMHEIRRVLPRAQLVRLVAPHHPIFVNHYVVRVVPQVSHAGFWYTHGFRTDERGSQSPEAVTYALLDHRARIQVLMTFNTDIGDVWERETRQEYFERFAVDGYALAINVVLYALTN